MMRRIGPALAVTAAIAIVAWGCRGSAGDAGDAVDAGPSEPAPPPPPPPAPPAGSVSWGPTAVSDPGRRADGIATALGVGQAAISWIEEADPGADVWFTTVAGSGARKPVAVTRDASAYPPTALEWSGKQFAIAWGDDRYRHVEIFVARVAWNGKIEDQPSRFTETVPPKIKGMEMFLADSSQTPTLAYYGGQLIASWGGPGDTGPQQVYYATITKGGDTGIDPVPLTSGMPEAVGMRLMSFEKGALLAYCVGNQGGQDLYRVLLTGTPPAAAQPVKVATSSYVPCAIDHALAGEGSMIVWVDRVEDRGGQITDTLKGQLTGASGEFVGKEIAFPGIRLVKFPGKSHLPFDALEVEPGKIAIAWINRGLDSAASLMVGLFDVQGQPLGSPFTVPTKAEPTDPHLVGSGEPGGFLVVWLDRELGAKTTSVLVSGLAFKAP